MPSAIAEEEIVNAKLSKIQTVLNLSGSKTLFHQEILIREELENILHHEEILWKQKLRCEWLNLGDRNTSYFHKLTVQRRNFNKITALRDSDGDWIFDPETLKTEVVKFFQNLYVENPGSLGTLPPSAFPSLNTEDADFLGKNVTNEEMRVALFDMASLKAPGSDVFQAAFFQNQWDNIGDAICEWVKKVFEGGIIEPEFNNTLISEIQKISLSSGLSAFARSWAKNKQASLLEEEVLHSMRFKKRLQWMVVKIDLEKAYDRVRWDFVEASLNATGIPSHLVKVLWNGEPTQKFRPVKGIQQGCYYDHTSLFSVWNGWVIDFTKASLQGSGIPFDYRAQVFLNNFCELSGHKVDDKKMNVFFPAGVNEPLRNAINSIISFQEVNDLGHYLGVPLFHRRVTNNILDFLVDRVRSQLSNWDAKGLFFPGRVTLAQLVLLSIPSYLMQSTLVSKGICDSIEELARQFI
ncbi:Retrovirus-related Pol polyprotein LINE-1 [Gossypium australe]|uniref:Retrovirus-related Pol polyprotein LINE-1 n=1 Tax=Gossypium australe TaxID=47621 RepID=A0A5B6WE52_9ROSI|nr:Retrovirus-related Pol polyprotein LINE-1 [Gossypium australe]